MLIDVLHDDFSARANRLFDVPRVVFIFESSQPLLDVRQNKRRYAECCSFST